MDDARATCETRSECQFLGTSEKYPNQGICKPKCFARFDKSQWFPLDYRSLYTDKEGKKVAYTVQKDELACAELCRTTDGCFGSSFERTSGVCHLARKGASLRTDSLTKYIVSYQCMTSDVKTSREFEVFGSACGCYDNTKDTADNHENRCHCTKRWEMEAYDGGLRLSAYLGIAELEKENTDRCLQCCGPQVTNQLIDKFNVNAVDVDWAAKKCIGEAEPQYDAGDADAPNDAESKFSVTEPDENGKMVTKRVECEVWGGAFFGGKLSFSYTSCSDTKKSVLLQIKIGEILGIEKCPMLG